MSEAYVPDSPDAGEISTPAADLNGKPDIFTKAVPTERDALKEAAEKALAEATPEKEAELDAVARRDIVRQNAQKAERQAPPPERAPAMNAFAAAVAKRERDHELAQARKEAQRQGEEAAQRREWAAKQAEDRYRAEFAKLEKLRTDPLTAIKELGWEPNDLVDSVVKSGTPEWKRMMAERAEREEMRLRVERSEARLQQYEESMRQRDMQSQVSAKQAAEQRFMTESVSADFYQASGGKQVAKPEEIAEYLEYELRDSSSGIATRPAAPKRPPMQRPNGSRTLSAASASERRASPKPFDDLNPREERAALIEAAEAAMRNV